MNSCITAWPPLTLSGRNRDHDWTARNIDMNASGKNEDLITGIPAGQAAMRLQVPCPGKLDPYHHRITAQASSEGRTGGETGKLTDTLVYSRVYFYTHTARQFEDTPSDTDI